MGTVNLVAVSCGRFAAFLCAFFITLLLIIGPTLLFFTQGFSKGVKSN